MAASVRDWSTVDYYAILGVERDASGEAITRAFRALAKRLHPDASDDPRASERFTEVAAAYVVLGDRRTRRDYDRVRAEAPPGPGRPVAPPAPPASPAPGSATGWLITWNRRRAWTALVGGVVVTLLGALTVGVAWHLHARDASERARFVPVTAARVEADGRPEIAFVTRDGRPVRVAEPQQHGDPATLGPTVGVRYDPADPTHVVADSSTFGRDITLAIVALKLLVGGPVFVVLGRRNLTRTRS